MWPDRLQFPRVLAVCEQREALRFGVCQVGSGQTKAERTLEQAADVLDPSGVALCGGVYGATEPTPLAVPARKDFDGSCVRAVLPLYCEEGEVTSCINFISVSTCSRPRD